MPEAPNAPTPAASTQSQSPAPAPQGPSNGMDLMANLSNLGPKPGSTPAPAPKQPDPQKQEAKKPDAPKPEAKKSSSETKTTGDAWEMEAVSLEEPKTEQKTVEEPAPYELKPEAQTKWKELKSKATELDHIKPEFEKLKAEYEKLKDTPTKLAPEIEAELTELKRFKAAYDVEGTEEYKTAVLQPYEANMSKIAEVADFAGVPMDKIEAALKETNTLARARALRTVFDSNPDGPEISSEEIGIVVRAADDLHASVFPKDKELRSKALEIKSALKGQQETMTAKQREAQEASLTTATSELYNIMESKLKPMGIFSNQEFTAALKAARPADPTKEPMSAAKQAMSAVMLPQLVTKYNEIATQLKEAKAALKARGEAGAGPGDGGRQEAPKRTDELDDGRSLMSGLDALIGRR